MEENRFILHGSNGRPFLVSFLKGQSEHSEVPLIIFVHGFKGFMDWGHFPLLAKKFSEAGFSVARFNFSHNGTTPEEPTDFVDLEAFGKNTYTKELFDLDTVITFFYEQAEAFGLNKKRFFLIGHSRGASIVLLKTALDKRISRVVALAPVSDLSYKWTQEEKERWKKDGVVYVYNSRTQQQMPLYIDLLEDYYDNKNLLNLQAQMKQVQVPNFLVHGKEDAVVPVFHSARLMLHNPYTRLFVVSGAGHTFGGKHPWKYPYLPAAMNRAFERIVRFFRKDRERLMDVRYRFR